MCIRDRIPEIRAAFPASAIVHQVQSDWPVALDPLVEEALAATLPAGATGAVHLQATRAAVLIDVDSGTPEEGGSREQTALAVNLAAATIVARQSRLRNLGGGIVVDFIGLERRGMRDKVRTALETALLPDPAQPRVLGWTRLGHLELVRSRHRRPLAEILLDDSGHKSVLTVAEEALRAVRREARASPGGTWRLRAAPEVAAAAAAILPALAERFALRIAIEPEPGRPRERFDILPG